MGYKNFSLPGYPDSAQFYGTASPAVDLSTILPARYTPSSYRGVMSGDSMPNFSAGIPAASNSDVLAALQGADVAASPGLWDKFTQGFKDSGFLGSFDKTTGVKTDGWGMPAMQAAQGLANAYMGMKQYGLFKDQLNFQKESFAKNYAAQQATLNTQLEDRQRARVASNAGAYQSVGEYMNTNRIK